MEWVREMDRVRIGTLVLLLRFSDVKLPIAEHSPLRHRFSSNQEHQI
jgi:hypothetical protein